MMRFLRLIALLAACGALSPGAVATAAGAGPAVDPVTGVSAAGAFAERYREVLHGGIVSAANSVVTCGEAVDPAAVPCAEVQQGWAGSASGYETAYVDVDSDRNTYNSSRAHLDLPRGAQVTHARLYWGANIRVGEQKPPEDSGRVLIAEPGGQYKELLADGPVALHDAGAYQSFTASADVTALVRQSGAGSYTVGQVNVAMGHSDTGGWGGWALVVAYEDADAPLRELVMMDGLLTLDQPGQSATVTVADLRTRPGGAGSLGVVAFGGDRGRVGDALVVSGGSGDAGDAPGVALANDANPAFDVMNSTIATADAGREPAHANTLGLDADVFDVSESLTDGPRQLSLRFDSGADSYQLGAVFLQVRAEARH